MRLTSAYVTRLEYWPDSQLITGVQEDVQEDWGWKLVHGEVFRRPQRPMLLSVLVGNGSQLSAMVGVTLG
jgi:hypothetical protein